MTTKINIHNIFVEGRHRKDLGDIESLADSIERSGLLHPIVVTEQHQLIAGERRLAAYKYLHERSGNGYEMIPAHIVNNLTDALSLLIAERDENTCRKDFAPSEAVAIGKQLKEIEAVEADKRKKSGVNQYTEPSGKLPPGSKGKTRDKVGEAVGMSGKTFEKAEKVIEYAQAVDMPELVELMDSKGVSAATTEMRRHETKQRLDSVATKEAKAIEGVYDVLVIDPPWEMKKIEREERPNQAEFEYPTMSLDEISRIEIPAADNCHVWLWTTHKYLPNAFGCFAAWGVKYICTFNWHKAGGFQPYNLPQFNNEFVLYGHIGAPLFVTTKDFKTSFEGKRGKHSEKPQEFYDMVRRVTAGRRLDMFSRRKIDGFDGWGKESE